ncbi:MAG: zinc ribbon domain-containing protein [Coriobacteriaceae bacterium]|nr:MAG: zinc ribbon domain-containing protein [Coriobacteriaceae bacterium]
MFCKNCGAELKPGTRFCPYCGVAVGADADTPDADGAADADDGRGDDGLSDGLDNDDGLGGGSYDPNLTQPMPLGSGYGAQAPRPVPQEPHEAPPQQPYIPGARRNRDYGDYGDRGNRGHGGAKAALVALLVVALCAAAAALVVFYVLPSFGQGGNATIAKSDDSSSSDSSKTITLGQSSGDDSSSSDSEHVGFKGITKAEATSTLPTDQYDSYGTDHLIDGDNTTCWSEGVSGLGVGESVTLSGDGVQTFSSFTIANGFQKSESIYYKNPRPTKLGVFVDGNKVMSVDLADSFGSTQSFTLPKPVDGTNITFQIEAATPGSKYEDTSISEITVQ